MDDQVRLPDLQVIRRYSIAVRREHAPLDEVVEALEADLAAITGRAPGGGRATGARRRAAAPRARTTTRRARRQA